MLIPGNNFIYRVIIDTNESLWKGVRNHKTCKTSHFAHLLVYENFVLYVDQIRFKQSKYLEIQTYRTVKLSYTIDIFGKMLQITPMNGIDTRNINRF